MGHQYSSLGTQPILCGSIPGLVPKQLRFCRNYVEIMPSVAEGVKIGIQECQHQFRGRRWNCTTVNDNLAIFGPVLDKGKVPALHAVFPQHLRCASFVFAAIHSCKELVSAPSAQVSWCFNCPCGVLAHLWFAKVNQILHSRDKTSFVVAFPVTSEAGQFIRGQLS